MKNMNYDSLMHAGLTDGEVKTYLALLKLGPSTSGPIVDEAGISRSIIYHILDKLMEKGLVSYIIKDKTRHFQAADPGQIERYLDEKEKDFEANRKEIEKLLPNLLAMRKSAKESTAQIYEGFKGMQTVHEHSYPKLKKDEEFYYLGIPQVQQEKYHLYWNRDHRRRIKAGIKCKLLFNQGTDIKILKNRNSFKGCDSRYMPIDIQTPAWFMGYKDTAVIGLVEEEIAIEIVNQKIADSFKAYFDAFWKKSKPFIYK